MKVSRKLSKKPFLLVTDELCSDFLMAKVAQLLIDFNYVKVNDMSGEAFGWAKLFLGQWMWKFVKLHPDRTMSERETRAFHEQSLRRPPQALSMACNQIKVNSAAGPSQKACNS